VTLIIAMSKAEGIYISADYRVTDLRTGRPVDDASIKFLTIHFPPEHIGPRALLAYSGLARLADGTSMGSWIRRTLRGQTEMFGESMSHLNGRLDRDIAAYGVPLVINVLVTHGDTRYVGGFSNLRRDATGGTVLERSFAYVISELTEPTVFVNGSGAARLVADRHLDLLRSQLELRPRKVMDHMKLLAAVNRRVAAKEKTVSPFCQVSFLNADEKTSPTSRTFVKKGEVVPFEMPVLLFGIDLSGVTRRFLNVFAAVKTGRCKGVGVTRRTR
jgi:hypothetical protein